MLRIIGRNLRKARLRSNLTLECVAEMSGGHPTTLSDIERGKQNFQVTRFVDLVRYLEVSPNRLLEGIPEKDNSPRIKRIKKAMTRKRKPAKRHQI